MGNEDDKHLLRIWEMETRSNLKKKKKYVTLNGRGDIIDCGRPPLMTVGIIADPINRRITIIQ